MAKKTFNYNIASFLLFTVLFLVGCNDINRKHFTTLEPTKIENGIQYFDYKASTGILGLTCAPGSRTCRIDNSGRAAIWPLENKEAEKTRIQWLEKSLAEQGYQDAEYEIVSRQPILVASGMYDISYDVRVLLRQ